MKSKPMLMLLSDVQKRTYKKYPTFNGEMENRIQFISMSELRENQEYQKNLKFFDGFGHEILDPKLGTIHDMSVATLCFRKPATSNEYIILDDSNSGKILSELDKSRRCAYFNCLRLLGATKITLQQSKILEMSSENNDFYNWKDQLKLSGVIKFLKSKVDLGGSSKLSGNIKHKLEEMSLYEEKSFVEEVNTGGNLGDGKPYGKDQFKEAEKFLKDSGLIDDDDFKDLLQARNPDQNCVIKRHCTYHIRQESSNIVEWCFDIDEFSKSLNMKLKKTPTEMMLSAQFGGAFGIKRETVRKVIKRRDIEFDVEFLKKEKM